MTRDVDPAARDGNGTLLAPLIGLGAPDSDQRGSSDAAGDFGTRSNRMISCVRLVLHGEDVGEMAIKAIGPNVHAARSVVAVHESENGRRVILCRRSKVVAFGAKWTFKDCGP